MSRMSSDTGLRLPLSVVVPTTQPWPELRMTLEALAGQALEAGAEILVADGHGRGLPDGGADGVRWLRQPGANVFELRARAIAEARGEIVAMTEDHCRPARDWCEQIVRVHAEHREAAVIGGAVMNGARGLVDWANFFISNEPAMPPERGPWRAGITGQANVSYKRSALAGYPADPLDEGLFRIDLESRGLALNDPRVRVDHVQSLGLGGSCAIHFHDGRCIGASRRSHYGHWRLRVEIVKDLMLPLRVPVATVRVIARAMRRHPSLRRTAVLGLPWVAAMTAFHAAGELAGVVAGPGDSPARMR